MNLLDLRCQNEPLNGIKSATLSDSTLETSSATKIRQTLSDPLSKDVFLGAEEEKAEALRASPGTQLCVFKKIHQKSAAQIG